MSGANSISRISASSPCVTRSSGIAQVLADVGPEVVDAAGEQLAGHRRRVFLLAGEQADRLGDADAVEHALQRVRRQVGEVGFLPAFLDAGEGELHAADVRQHLEAILAEPVAQVAGDAVEERIAAGDDDHALAAEVGFEHAHRILEFRPDGEFLRLDVGHSCQALLGAEDQLGGAEQIAGACGEPGHAVAADADHVNLRLGHGTDSSISPQRTQRSQRQTHVTVDSTRSYPISSLLSPRSLR